MKQIILIAIALALLLSCNNDNESPWIITAPAGSEFCKIDTKGKSILPNGRFIEPVGKSYLLAPHPYGLVLSPDGKIAVTANSGTNPLSISIIRNLDTDNPDLQQVPPGPTTDKGVLASVFMGLAITPDSKKSLCFRRAGKQDLFI
ncbi:MAG: hypothetical protein HC831_06325 [Chloroflexia bacterium]|nr:hypothetical protein [Chloroflexia bacterium]